MKDKRVTFTGLIPKVIRLLDMVPSSSARNVPTRVGECFRGE